MFDAAALGVMAGGAEVYIPAFGLALGMSPVVAGLLATLPLLAGGVLQLIAPRAIPRVRSLRRWTAGCATVQGLSLIPLLAVAVVGHGSTLLVFAAASLYWAAGMAASAGWTPWMARVVPERLRSRYLGRRQGLVHVTMLVALVISGVALHAHGGSPRIFVVYAAMFGTGMLARLGSALAIARQGHGVAEQPRRRMRFRSIPGRLLGTPKWRLLAYLIATLAASSISGPFLTPYLLVQRGLSYAEYTIFTAAILVTKMIVLPIAGRYVQRLGVRRVLTVCAIAIVPIPLFWMTTTTFAWFVTIQIYSGIAWAGFDLGVLMTLFDADDDAERTTMQVAFSALQAAGTAGASLIGGAVLASGAHDPGAYQSLFALSAIARVAAVMLLLHQLPKLLLRVPVAMMVRAWSVAIRPWGGTILRPLVEGLGKLGGARRDPPGPREP